MKKVMSIGLILVLVLSVFSPTSFASEDDYNWVVGEVERVNDEIDKMIEKAVEDAQKEIDKFEKDVRKTEETQDNKAEEKIIDEESKLDDKIDKIIEKLVSQTNKLAERTIEKAAKLGIEVICEYEEVEIGGKTILIDPLRICGF